jgi:hypothetical protein
VIHVWVVQKEEDADAERPRFFGDRLASKGSEAFSPWRPGKAVSFAARVWRKRRATEHTVYSSRLGRSEGWNRQQVIAPLVADGKITKYQATPEYQGKSFIPIAVKIVASEPGRFETTLNIWGEALGRGTEPGQMREPAVIVRFDYGESNLDALHELEDRLTQALAKTDVGECDGNDVTPDLSKATLYLYGSDAEHIFAVAEPILVRAECVRNGMATLRFGPPEDGVPERVVRLAATNLAKAEEGS